MKKKKIAKTIKTINIIISIIVLTLFIYGLINISKVEDSANSIIYTHGAPAIFFISIILDMLPQFISPMIILATGILAGMNVLTAIVMVAIGSVIGSTLGFIIGEKYMIDGVLLVISEKKVQRASYLINKYGKVIIPIAAVSPLPYLPVLLGALKISRKNFFIYGILPRIMGIIAFGYLVSLL